MTEGTGLCPTDPDLLQVSEGQRNIRVIAARMLATGSQIPAHLWKPITSDHSCLYDENGFPR